MISCEVAHYMKKNKAF